MIRIILLAILTSSCFISFSQAEDKKMAMLIISYHGNSTLFSEMYEIDFNKKKVFSITPNISYLHIKGGKLRIKIKLNNKEWRTISGVALMIDFEKLRASAKATEQKSTCSLEYILVDKERVRFRLSEENIPRELRTLLETIRNSKDNR